MEKRILDITLASLLLIITAPVLLLAILAVYLEDKTWPIYSSPRAARGGGYFRMHKIRTMFSGADKKSDVTATPLDDARITKTGALLRRCKIDELLQLLNVLSGEMSLVGPRPQVEREVVLYTEAEQELLVARPGITDFSSIVFSDLAEILAGSTNPNQAYAELVRPWKSRLGVFYVRHEALWVDVALIVLTAVNIVSRRHALQALAWMLQKLGAPEELVEISRRRKPLVPSPILGAD